MLYQVLVVIPSAKVAIDEFPEYILSEEVPALFLRANLMFSLPNVLKVHIALSELYPGLFGLFPQ